MHVCITDYLTSARRYICLAVDVIEVYVYVFGCVQASLLCLFSFVAILYVSIYLFIILWEYCFTERVLNVYGIYFYTTSYKNVRIDSMCMYTYIMHVSYVFLWCLIVGCVFSLFYWQSELFLFFFFFEYLISLQLP